MNIEWLVDYGWHVTAQSWNEEPWISIEESYIAIKYWMESLK